MDFDDYLFEKYNLKYMNDVITIFQARDAAKEYYSELSRLRSEGSPANKVPTIHIEEWPVSLLPDGLPATTEWVASWNLFPGMVVSADTREKAIDELMTSIRVKLLFDLQEKPLPEAPRDNKQTDK